MPMGDKNMDMTEVIINNYEKHQLDALVCLGGGGTQKNAFRLHKKGLNIITLPKTIDNDVAMTDATFGFDTALNIATEAIDRLHSTAHSHHRIIVVEVMGHNTGWLALGAGLAGGADVVLIPEIPYQIECVAAAIRQRSRGGKGFSIVAVSEGAMSSEDHKELGALQTKLDKLKRKKAKNNKAAKSTQSAKSKKADKKARQAIKDKIDHLHGRQSDSTLRLTHALEKMTGLESRLTILGHVQRGGIPSPVDRLLATRLGTGCGQLIHDEVFGVMVAARGEGYEAVPLEKVAGNRKTVPIDHPWVESARLLGINLGD
jgi:6-phosphofructokinase 1